MQDTKRSGPFQTAGVILNTVSTAAGVLDNTVSTTGTVMHNSLKGVNTIVSAGSEAIEIVASGALEDLKADYIIEDAYRQVRISQAKAEAKKILADSLDN